MKWLVHIPETAPLFPTELIPPVLDTGSYEPAKIDLDDQFMIIHRPIGTITAAATANSQLLIQPDIWVHVSTNA